jgi:hypothetical protein
VHAAAGFAATGLATRDELDRWPILFLQSPKRT